MPSRRYFTWRHRSTNLTSVLSLPRELSSFSWVLCNSPALGSLWGSDTSIWPAAVALPWEQILESLRTSGLYHLHDANAHRHTPSPDPPSESRTEYSWHPIVPTTLSMGKPEVLDLPVSPPVHPIPLLLLLPETKSLYPHCSPSIIRQAFHFYPPQSCFPTSAITPSSCRPEVALAPLFLNSLILSSNSIYKDRVICQRRKWVNPSLWLPRGF